MVAGSCEIQIVFKVSPFLQRADALAEGPDLLAVTINPYYVLSPISCCILKLRAVKIQRCSVRLLDKSGKDVNN